MILTCPNCGTPYVVKDGPIPPQGRQVRCASCKHSWHQDPEAASELEMGPEMQPADATAEDESFSEATMIDPSTGPEAEERAYEEAVIEEASGDAPPADEPADDDQIDVRAPVALEVPEQGDRLYADTRPDDDFSPFADRDYVETQRRSP
jgi:predicted Zn finger-like uncharacterized protein